MKAIILAAGLGTRLKPLTDEIPKVMLPLKNKPLLYYQINWFKKYGITDIAINLHHLPKKIRSYLGDGSKFNVKITYSYEKELLGTAGAIKKLEKFFGNAPFLIFYGDNITNLDLNQFINFHKEKKGIMTICLHKKQEREKDFGIAVLDKNNQISDFIEKPSNLEISESNLINSGIYIAKSEIFNFIPENKFYDFAHDLFPLLLKSNKKLFGYYANYCWTEIGNLEKYEKVKKGIENSKFSFHDF